jgi:selenide,water dikinase
MIGSHVPVLKDLVLVGGGHSHVIVLKRLGMDPMPGVRVTVIAKDVDTPYSGMLPGLIAGHYQFDDVHIDLGRLAMFAGARLYHDEVVGLDLAHRRVLCRHRPPVSYDAVSIDIGVTPIQRVEGAADHAVPIKPITTLVSRWERLRERVRQQVGGLRIGVVGAGAAGIELTLAIQHALKAPSAAAPVREDVPDFHLFSSTETVLPTHGGLARAKFRRVLHERGVQVHLGCRVVAVYSDGIETDDGVRHPLDEIIWATEAGAQPWPRAAGLEVDDRGFITVDDTLRSTSHPDVFAAGDIAAMVNHPRDKAGVFAVRQGPPLEANLRRALHGQPLEPFRPQRTFLSLISTGDRYAIASRGRWAVEGRWVWQWKDWIDRRFMSTFSDLPDMDASKNALPPDLSQLAAPDTVEALSSSAMRCGGCGSKVGATVLERVLSRLKPVGREDVVVGLESADDAAVEQVPPGMVAVRTVDAFRAIVDDPYMFGRITAHHCLGDIYAMGASPGTALAIATVPVAPEEKMEQLLEELLTGAVEVLNEAGAALVGGHTKEGLEMELGLALSGIADLSRLLRKSGMRPGDRLILTKPIGTGTLFAAHMRLRAKGRWIDEAIRSMTLSSLEASACVRRHGATACTDVTGFGVVGHLLEMTRASRVDATLSLSSIPLLTGAADTARAGFLSSLQPQNIRLRRAVANHDAVREASPYPLLFDPQTAGGLLASVPAAHAASCLTELHALGYPDAAEVGAVAPRSDPDAPITVQI